MDAVTRIAHEVTKEVETGGDVDKIKSALTKLDRYLATAEKTDCKLSNNKGFGKVEGLVQCISDIEAIVKAAEDLAQKAKSKDIAGIIADAEEIISDGENLKTDCKLKEKVLTKYKGKR